ncbi:MAG: hypothetical protein ACLTT1_00905 [[Clostridium] scindens]
MKKENLATVLDSLSELYIYIIEQETHRLLYFNQRVKEASPDVKVGACCSELWHENCEDCPLLSMGDQDYSHVIHYNTPFGRSWWTSLPIKDGVGWNTRWRDHDYAP